MDWADTQVDGHITIETGSFKGVLKVHKHA